MLPDRDRERLHHLAVEDDLRPRRVHRHVVVLLRGPRRDLGHVLARHRLQPVVAATRDADDREAAQQPRDVVQKDVAVAEDERRPHDRPREPRLAHGPLGPRLAGVVVEVGIFRGVADRDVHHLAHARVAGCAHEDASVGHRLAETDAPVLEADPVRVVEHVGAAERIDQRGAVAELERRDLGHDVLRPRALRMVGQRLERPVLGHQSPGDESAGVAVSAGDDVEAQNGNRVRS